MLWKKYLFTTIKYNYISHSLWIWISIWIANQAKKKNYREKCLFGLLTLCVELLLAYLRVLYNFIVIIYLANLKLKPIVHPIGKTTHKIKWPNTIYNFRIFYKITMTSSWLQWIIYFNVYVSLNKIEYKNETSAWNTHILIFVSKYTKCKWSYQILLPGYCLPLLGPHYFCYCWLKHRRYRNVPLPTVSYRYPATKMNCKRF